MTVDGEFIDAGVTLGSSIYTLQRDPRHFYDPEEYHPERWIADPSTGVTQEGVKNAHAGFHPFSLGSRSCIGWKLALMEISVAVSRTLFLHDLRMGPEAECCGGKLGKTCEFPIKGWVTSATADLMMQFRPKAA